MSQIIVFFCDGSNDDVMDETMKPVGVFVFLDPIIRISNYLFHKEATFFTFIRGTGNFYYTCQVFNIKIIESEDN